VEAPLVTRTHRSRRGGKPPVWPGLVGGRFQPLTRPEMERIHATVLDVMEQIGFADAIPSMVELVTAAGGWVDDDGRLHYPRSLVDDVIARAPRSFVLPGQDPVHDLELGGGRVHTGTAGAAPLILDFETGLHRPTTTVDLYDIARLVDTLDHIHFYWRSVVARDMPTWDAIDLHTVYACMLGTTKHICSSFNNGGSVRTAVAMMDMALGEEGGFRKRPFCSIACTHVVPPLRFARDSCEAMEAAVRAGMAVGILSAPQAGATSPVTLAGTIVQTMAECLAGLIFCFLIDPECRAHLGTWPFVSDLRTGAMTGGSAENGLLVAGCAQMAGFYDLPGSVAAGMTDSKVPDAQAGSEKAYTVMMAANAGSSLITEAAGMQASLMSTAFEAYVIDDDMLAAVQRTVRGIEVTDETLAFDMIRDVVGGDGHFLGHPETRRRMRSDFVYPAVGDRESPNVWESGGSRDIRERARQQVRETLASHYPGHISRDTDDRIRDAFGILLPPDAMRPGNGRW
jgi:trimethylamine--corrinoid protein Co-methyltransferase